MGVAYSDGNIFQVLWMPTKVNRKYVSFKFEKVV